jgi:hypothetical protein
MIGNIAAAVGKVMPRFVVHLGGVFFFFGYSFDEKGKCSTFRFSARDKMPEGHFAE